MSTKIDFMQELTNLLAIPSEMGDPTEGAPFGAECRRALDYYLGLGERMGFATYNADGYAGHIEYGEGETVVGVLVHLDVVPAGDGWSTPPYEATVRGGKLYARGAMDDKGPAMIALFALYELKQELESAGKTLGARIRIIAGTNEENGSKCIAYYKTKTEMPHIAFSPDSDFPLINCEKTLLGYKIELPQSAEFKKYVERIAGGKAHNAVPDYAECTLKNCLESLPAFSGISGITAQKNGDKIEVISKGISAHSMEAEKGDNAILKLLHAVRGAGIGLERANDLEWLNSHLTDNVRGTNLDIAFSDDFSGSITVNFVRIENTEKTVSVLLDMRVPISVTPEQIEQRIKAQLPQGARLEQLYYSPYLFVPEQGFLVSTLLDIYRTSMGKPNAKPLVTGGGTYARTMTNCVAFGATMEGNNHRIHSSDEYLILNDIIIVKDMFKQAMLRLAEFKPTEQ